MDQPVSSRDLRKAEQLTAILKREETQRTVEEAQVIATKSPELRTPQDLIFAQQNRKLVEKAEKRIRERLLEEERKQEIFDTERDIDEKCQILADLLQSGKHVIAYTGAGISTAADIPDYRGPNGVWTRTEKGESCVDPSKPLDLTKAQPTYTHMAFVKLHEAGLLKYIVSQNCDGLHVRSGFPRTCLSEVHGNMYLEMCGDCEPEMEYFRPFDITTKTRWRRHRTGRKCHQCDTDLEDTIVLFGEKSRTNVPMNWQAASEHAKAADVVLCFGTSLKVLKDYPCLWNRHQKLVIVNLQWTPKDEKCHLKIHARCDEVMRRLMSHLKVQPNNFDGTKDPLHTLVVPLRKREKLDNISLVSDGVSKPGWFGQGIKSLVARSKNDSGRSSKKKKTQTSS